MFLLQTISLNAQSGQRSLSGQVVDSHNEPLPGANVYLKGDIHNGTSTDAEGYFLLKIPAGQNKVVIEASFIGMKPYSVDYQGQRELLIVMEDDSNMMESAVVMGKQNEYQ